MYQINKPIRIAQRGEDMYLVSLPSIGIRIEANRNVVDFLEYLIDKEKFESIDIIVKEYTAKYNVTNIEDYMEMLSNMVDIQLLVNN